MTLRILFDENKVKQGLYRDEDPVVENSAAGWPCDTWFQKRLRFVREQQRRRGVEADVVYEGKLGTIIVRQSNGEN
jgi:hypothetical protein